MSETKVALQFLETLERAETDLLSWGFVEGCFSEEELVERGNDHLENTDTFGEPFDSGEELVESLIDKKLLWRLPGTDKLRTRMAESIRLIVRLKQILPWMAPEEWRSAPNLVSDYRFLLKPRIYPRRHIGTDNIIGSIKEVYKISKLQEEIVKIFIRDGFEDQKYLSKFQVGATTRILNETQIGRNSGTVICAGTGSGKTLGFYLPAYMSIAQKLTSENWTKCVALYPRNELLKDQLREAVANAKLVAPVLESHGKRRIAIGVLYGDVPRRGSDIAKSSGRKSNSNWKRISIPGQEGFECPFLKCPTCGDPMVWRKKDLNVGKEYLYCFSRVCDEYLGPDEIRLTRESLIANPPDILFTTTEMLNQRVSSSHFQKLFGVGLRSKNRPYMVLLDEAHAYEGSHGAHVAFLIRRWRNLARLKAHFVGLSATLAEAPKAFADLTGLRVNDIAEITPSDEECEAKGAEYLLAIKGDPASGTSLLSTTIQTAMLVRRILDTKSGSEHFGSKLFCFTDNLDVTNRLYFNLLDAEGWNSYRKPNLDRPAGSLANLRSSSLPEAASRLESGQNWEMCEQIGHVLAQGARTTVGRTSSQDKGVDVESDVVVATSSLEVGFDDPNVGAVIQHKAPMSMSSFLQRKGRAGRPTSMRPWTVVTLTDFGRDRQTFLEYDRLFSPQLPVRYLPVTNQAVLKIQATYALIDYLGMIQGLSPTENLWSDLASPSQGSQQWEKVKRQRQKTLANELKKILDDSATRASLVDYLRQALMVNESTIESVLWDQPRALLMEVVPTLLRRLEKNWDKAASNEKERFVLYHPLPEFMPKELFSSLQSPEIFINIPSSRGVESRTEGMPLFQALREFSPGRVSRRYGVTHGGERYWVDPGSDASLSIDRICPASNRDELGRFTYIDSNGEYDAIVFKPYALMVSAPNINVPNTANSFPEWKTDIAPSDKGLIADSPVHSPWETIALDLHFHMHRFGNPLEVCRYMIACKVSGTQRGSTSTEKKITLTCSTNDINQEQAGLGFIADADGIELQFICPPALFSSYTDNHELLRTLRVLKFQQSFQESRSLDEIANTFQKESLGQAFLSTILAESMDTDKSLKEVITPVLNGNSQTSLIDTIHMISRWESVSEDNEQYKEDSDENDSLPSRLEELVNLIEVPDVKSSLAEAATALFEPVDSTWEPWLKRSFKTTLGAVVYQAILALCPRMSENDMTVDLDARRSGLTSGKTTKETIWLTESNIGGGGVVEEFYEKYSEDPRRFHRILEAMLEPGNLEWVGLELESLVGVIDNPEPDARNLVSAIKDIRNASTHKDHLESLGKLREELSILGFRPTQTFLSALSARVLRPGSSDLSDKLLADLLLRWENAEKILGVEIDVRSFSYWCAKHVEIENRLGFAPGILPGDNIVNWRYGVLMGMLWVRGGQARQEGLRFRNPFHQIHECDRMLVKEVLSQTLQLVRIDSVGWEKEFEAILSKNGMVGLVSSITDKKELGRILLDILTRRLENTGFLVYPRVAGVRQSKDDVIAIVDLPEAIQ